ncbi:amidohydrolase family protein [Streptomyces sp. NPDC037389]|uniref:amidohydrolase family protein n=1 Tax=Streptomyces sp. NPDC037389 TaxID=3155369 RepID=UPI0033D8FCDA
MHDTLLLTHTTLIAAPGTRGPEQDMTVVVRDGSIVTVGRTAEVPVPHGARVMDLSGKYVIPGLVDMHTHSHGPAELVAPLYVLTGVTTVREMWGTPAVRAGRDRVEQGDFPGPRWVIASTLVDGRPSLWTDDASPVPVVEAGTEAEAREAVRRIKEEGADFIKVYSRLTREVYLALADEARRRGIPYAGHCPDAVSVTEASDAGQRTIEHLHPLLTATSSEQSTLRREMEDGLKVDPTDTGSISRCRRWFRRVHQLESLAARSYDPERADRVFDRLAANGTHVTPTLGIHHVMERQDTLPKRAPEWVHLPSWLTGAWPSQLEELMGGRTEQEYANVRDVNVHHTRIVGELHRHGVPLLAGTDSGAPYLVPGFALHQELEHLTLAGLGAAHALRAATTTPAHALGLEALLGTIEPGKAADLVVLDADPLDDIRNTRRVDSVVTRGHLIDRAERRRLLAQIAQAAAELKPPAGMAS